MPLDDSQGVDDWVVAGLDEESQRAQDAFARNKAWLKPGSEVFSTTLNPDQEGKFQAWVKSNNVPFDSSAASDYDMRGFWQASQDTDAWKKMQQDGKIPADMLPAGTKIDPNDGRPHYPDYWKTPYHQTFSSESQWADPNKAPQWNEKDQLVAPDGAVLFDDKAQNKSSIDDWIIQHEPPIQPVVGAPLTRIADAAVAGFKQGYGGGENSETEAANARADRDLGALAPIIHGVNYVADHTGNVLPGLFRGAQAGVAQIGAELGAPQLGRDVAAIPEAFMGSPGSAGVADEPVAVVKEKVEPTLDKTAQPSRADRIAQRVADIRAAAAKAREESP